AHDQLRFGIETALVDLANADARILVARRDDAVDDRRETVANRDVIIQKLLHRPITSALDPPAIERAVMSHHYRRRVIEPLDQQARLVPDRNRQRAERARHALSPQPILG